MCPRAEDLQRAADVLNAGEKVAMLVGAGALHATAEVIEVAELLGAGVAKALLGKAAVPDDLPFVTGSIGLLGTKPSYEMMMDCDTLLMVGSAFPYSEFLPEEGQARGVQIDIDGRMLSLRYPMEVNLVGDSAQTLRALMPLLDNKRRPLLAQTDRKTMWPNGGKLLEAAGHGTGRTRSTRSACSGNSRRACPTTASSPAIPARRQLVCARPEDPPRHDGLAVGRPGHHGPRRALCDRGEVRLSRPAGHRPGRRRRDADELASTS